MAYRNKVIGKLPLVEMTENKEQVLEISVSYNEGGMNYFSGNSNVRGYYLHVSPISESIEGTVKIRSFTMFSGIKMLLKEVRRFNQREFETLTPTQEQINKLVNHVLEKENLHLKEKEIVNI